MTDYQENFIQKMRFYRKRAGITQAGLAELCSVSNGTIGNIECGITKPSFDLIIKIAESIKVQPAELFKTEIVSPSWEEKLSKTQVEIVKESLHSAMDEVVNKALSDIKFKIDHS
ncbi:helix-turn-helix transcriptional regulator [Treponema sp.]|uniref:helix-turn-helix domain-containing protein n=1 Tax=Treponema sp. TaxID=166 RepID=UPI0025DE1FA4|nr:helix-turn-helix transcriptional regulator [Treponema sp.]MBQ7537936.1 helix-turn-helix transcriptional regulator [Treponema sp.]MBR4323885.1 helix-turn-helix transcriptional regulator [Treponema sp.]